MKVRDRSTQESQPEPKRKRLPKSMKIILFVVGGVLVLAAIGFAVLRIYMNATVYKDAVDIVAAPETSAAGEPEIEEISEEEYLSDAGDEEEYVQQEPEDIYEAIEISDRIYNVLVIGDDARITQDHGRSDSMLLCSYNRDTGDIKVVSFMRDMLVPTTEGGSWKRINSTYASGGSGKTINTINRLFALDIQRYVIVRFDSVFALVDEIDGIDIEITSAEARYVNRIFPEYDQLSEGLAHMNGGRRSHTQERVTSAVWEAAGISAEWCGSRKPLRPFSIKPRRWTRQKACWLWSTFCLRTCRRMFL